MKIKEEIKKIPLVSQINNKRHYHIIKSEYESLIFANKKIDARLRKKIQNKEKINVVFVCHRPAVWSSLRTVYINLKKNPMFNTEIFAIPKITPETGKLSDEGAKEYFSEYNAIDGYRDNHYLDLKSLKPDFVFFQQPYNSAMPEIYNSSKVAQYSHICYVPYFPYLTNMNSSDVFYECTPKDYFKDVSYFFAQSEEQKDKVKIWMKDTPNIIQYYVPGYARFDDIERHIGAESDIWSNPRSKKDFRIIWTPRWCTNENNCHFFEYKDKILELCEKHSNIDLVFRPHPQSWANWEATGEFTKEEANKYKDKYNHISNAKIDINKDYIDMFFSSDCLITDLSTIIPEYFLTGKPIIYCDKENSKNTYLRHGGYSESFYWAYSWDEVEKIVNMLMLGQDPLKEERLKYINTEFKKDKNPAGEEIMKILTDIVKNA